MFSDSDIQLFTRNVEDILSLHKDFVDELKAELAPLGIPLTLQDLNYSEKEPRTVDTTHIDQAIYVVASKFATYVSIHDTASFSSFANKSLFGQSSRFEPYTSFCAGHSEALDIVHRVQQSNSASWDAYEQRSALLASYTIDGLVVKSISEEETGSPSTMSVPSVVRKRSASLSAVDKGNRPRPQRVATTAAKPEERPSKAPVQDRSCRLSFGDFLIKPVQRICRYHLLLEHLVTGRELSLHPLSVKEDKATVANAIVRQAAEAMQRAASSVNEARHQHSVAHQSSAIASRILVATPSTVSVSAEIYIQAGIITHSFLSSLGACLLAGSLDVLDLLSAPLGVGTAYAKYLGIFLYPGGYIVMVKVRSRTVYEPKHWFRLNDFGIADVRDDDGAQFFPFDLQTDPSYSLLSQKIFRIPYDSPMACTDLT